MIYLGNGTYELSNGEIVSKDNLKEILEEFYYNNSEVFNFLIDGFNLHTEEDVIDAFDRGKDKGFDIGYSEGFDEGFKSGESSKEDEVLETLMENGFNEAFEFLKEKFLL